MQEDIPVRSFWVIPAADSLDSFRLDRSPRLRSSIGTTNGIPSPSWTNQHPQNSLWDELGFSHLDRFWDHLEEPGLGSLLKETRFHFTDNKRANSFF